MEGFAVPIRRPLRFRLIALSRYTRIGPLTFESELSSEVGLFLCTARSFPYIRTHPTNIGGVCSNGKTTTGVHNGCIILRKG